MGISGVEKIANNKAKVWHLDWLDWSAPRLCNTYCPIKAPVARLHTSEDVLAPNDDIIPFMISVNALHERERASSNLVPPNTFG